MLLLLPLFAVCYSAVTLTNIPALSIYNCQTLNRNTATSGTTCSLEVCRFLEEFRELLIEKIVQFEGKSAPRNKREHVQKLIKNVV